MRLRFRYSLKFFLLCWLLIGLGLGWFGIHWQSARRQADAVKAIALGSVSYDYELEHYDRTNLGSTENSDDSVYMDWKHLNPLVNMNKTPRPGTRTSPLSFVSAPSEPAWLIRGLGVDFFHPITSYTFPNYTCGVHLFVKPKLTVGLGKEMDHLAALPHLRYLHLWLDEIDAPQVMESSLLPHLGDFRDLEELTLEELPLTAEHLAPLRNHPKLRELTLSHEEITDETLAALGTLPALEKLDLRQCSAVGEAGFETLANWKKLRSVDLAKTACDDRIIASLVQLTELEELNLSQTKIGVKTLQGLRTLPRLKRLNLAGVQLSDAELAEVFQGWSSLETLDLSDTNAGELFTAQYESLTGLKYLNLIETPISQKEELADKLTQQFEDCSLQIGRHRNEFYGGGGAFGGGGTGFDPAVFSEEDAEHADETLDPNSATGGGVF